MTLDTLRAQLARQDAKHDKRLRAILKPQKRRISRAAAWPSWLSAMPLKPMDKRQRINDTVLNHFARRRTH